MKVYMFYSNATVQCLYFYKAHADIRFQYLHKDYSNSINNNLQYNGDRRLKATIFILLSLLPLAQVSYKSPFLKKKIPWSRFEILSLCNLKAILDLLYKSSLFKPKMTLSAKQY